MREIPEEFKKTQVTVRINSRQLERFRNYYPYMLSRFLDAAIHFANISKDNFESVLWHNVK